MRGRLTRTITAIGIGIAGLAAIATTAAAPASAATGVQLTPSKPFLLFGDGYVMVNVGKASTTAPYNYTFSATVAGKPAALDPVNGGSIGATCGQKWKVVETRVRTADYFLVGGARVATRSYTGVAPTDPTCGNKPPTSPDINANVKVGTPTKINVLAKAVDPDGDSTKIGLTGSSTPTYGTVSIVTLSTGRLGIRYVPNANVIAGTVDTFQVYMNDEVGLGGVINVNVTLVPSGGIG